jgi:hypothetical protein
LLVYLDIELDEIAVSQVPARHVGAMDVHILIRLFVDQEAIPKWVPEFRAPGAVARDDGRGGGCAATACGESHLAGLRSGNPVANHGLDFVLHLGSADVPGGIFAGCEVRDVKKHTASLEAASIGVMKA